MNDRTVLLIPLRGVAGDDGRAQHCCGPPGRDEEKLHAVRRSDPVWVETVMLMGALCDLGVMDGMCLARTNPLQLPPPPTVMTP